MKNINLSLLVLLLKGIVFVNVGFAQDGFSGGAGPVWNNTTLAAHMNELTNKFRNWDGSSIKLADIKGSMYYHEDFQMGKVFLGSQYHGSYLMRYNAFTDQIEAKKTKEHEPEGIAKSVKLAFEVGDERFVLKSFLNEANEQVEGYLSELVAKKNYGLYLRKGKIYKEGKKAQTPNQSDVPPRFLDDRTFYLEIGDTNPQRFKNSKGSFLKIIPKESQGDVKKFIKENSVSFKEREDLIGLVNFMNSL